MMRPTVVSGSGAAQEPYEEGLPGPGSRRSSSIRTAAARSGHSPPAFSGGRRGVAHTLVGDGQGEARSILRLRGDGGGGRLKGGRYVVGRGRIPGDGKGVEAVRSGGGDAQTGRRDAGHVCRVRVVLQEIFLLRDLDAQQCRG